jgi:hypothetical protein
VAERDELPLLPNARVTDGVLTVAVEVVKSLADIRAYAELLDTKNATTSKRDRIALGWLSFKLCKILAEGSVDMSLTPFSCSMFF